MNHLMFWRNQSHTSRLVRVVALVLLFVLATLPFRSAQAQSTLTVQIQSGGVDSTQQSQFNVLVKNTSAAAQSNISFRVYFTLDAGQVATGYALEKYWDQSGIAVISGPTLASGSSYYYTVSFGATALAAGATWQFNTAIHLASWASAINPAAYWYHAGYALGALPAAFTNDSNIPAYVGTTLVWGAAPGGSGTAVPTTAVPSKTNTPTTGPSLTPSKTNTPTTVPSKTNTPTTGPSLTPSKTNTVAPSKTNTPTFVPTTAVPPTKTNTPSTPTITPTLGNGTHLANPFVGASWFVNPDWAAEVNASGVTASQKSTVSHISTFIWLDSIDAVNGTNGYGHSLAGYLDAALAAGNNLVGIVVYDLPNRDCSALASNGELLMANDGFNKYKTLYIDPIYNVISQAKYSSLRIVAVIEPDSLPNLVTNLSFAKCTEATGAGGYVDGTKYTLNKLHPVFNFYAYIDIGHAGWLGWDTNFTPASDLIANAILATTAAGNSVDGFISNTANTSVQVEPFMTANQTVGSGPVRSATFYQWNLYIDESPYDAAWAAKMATKGVKNGMLIDTSRNGWGGCGGGAFVSQQCRPTAASTSTVLDTFVNASRIDRRPGKGDWCNQDGAGMGVRPVANPTSVYQAYVWVKPPGESDGSSTLVPTGPDNPGGKGFDRMCDPTYGGNALNNNVMTNALAGAPVSGRWFEAQFDQLVANAFPAIP